MSKGSKIHSKERLIDFTLGHSLLDILRFISSQNVLSARQSR